MASLKLRHVPGRLAAGAFTLHAGIEKLSASPEHAAGVHGMAAGTYPVVLVSYELACGSYPEQETADLVKAFFSFIVSEEGQQAASENAGSAPISDEQRQEFQTAIDGITAGA